MEKGTLKVITYKDASRARGKNKRTTIIDRQDGKGFYLLFEKLNDPAEDSTKFCDSFVQRGIRYTRVSITTEALHMLLCAAISRLKEKGELTIKTNDLL